MRRRTIMGAALGTVMLAVSGCTPAESLFDTGTVRLYRARVGTDTCTDAALGLDG